jgi:hypothetical protein
MHVLTSIKDADCDPVVRIMSHASVAVAFSSNLGHPMGGLFLSEKLQNVTAITDLFALFWQLQHN